MSKKTTGQLIDAIIENLNSFSDKVSCIPDDKMDAVQKFNEAYCEIRVQLNIMEEILTSYK